MAQQKSFYNAYSDLEVDKSAEAPELAWHVNAPEPDYTASELQVYPVIKFPKLNRVTNEMSRLYQEPDSKSTLTRLCRKP